MSLTSFVLGGLVFALSWFIFLPILKIIYVYKLKVHCLSKRKTLKKYGEWAIVTGCTDGIGKAYATLLASEGMNLICISRNLEKLKNLTTELENDYKIKTKVCVVDFTNVDVYDTISQELNDLDVGVLINNVGMVYPEGFSTVYNTQTLSDKDVRSVINCNVYSCIGMIRSIVPGMIQRGKGGVVVNIASYSAVAPFPFMTIYAATKAFMDALTRSVRLELSSEATGIDMQCVLPFLVSTKMSRSRPSFFCPTAHEFVDSALSLIGVESRITGCFSHDLQALLVSIMPRSWADKIMLNGMKVAMKREKLKKKQN